MNTSNQFGKTTTLRLVTKHQNGSTFLEDTYFTAPFKIMNPFYLSKDHIEVMLLSASAAIMAGDRQEISLKVTEGSKLTFTSQSYEKIHKMEEGSASRQTDITVEKNAYLKYMPLPVIPFAGSAFSANTVIHLADESAKFIMCDIISCGRYARGEQFAYHYYKSLVTIYCNEKMIYRDNTNYRPEQMELSQIGMFEGYHHVANLIFCNLQITEEQIQKFRAYIDCIETVSGGVTRLESGDVLVKIFGNTAQNLEEICRELCKDS